MKKLLFFISVFVLGNAFLLSQDIDHDGVFDIIDNCKCVCDHMNANPTGQKTTAIIISANPNSGISTGILVTFSSIVDAQGTSPIYPWKKNAINVGSNTATYIDNSVSQGDIITCILTSTVVCPAGNNATGNALTLHNGALAIKENLIHNNYGTFPNPTADSINISTHSKIISAELFDISGKNSFKIYRQ